ncbi:MAG: EF-hand domain-containing protein [Opitutales bacterium]
MNSINQPHPPGRSILIGLSALALALPLAGKPGNDRFVGPPERDPVAMRQAVLERFDADGDGLLSPGERAAARQAAEDRRQAFLDRFDANGDGLVDGDERTAVREAMQAWHEAADTDGDGRLSPAEREAAGVPPAPERPRIDRDRLRQHFDTDGDGQLSESERAAAREAIRERRERRMDRIDRSRPRPGAEKGRGPQSDG